MHTLKLFSRMLIPVLILVFSGCSKKTDTTTPVTPVNPVNPTPPASPYYFRFTLNNKTDTIVAGDAKSYTTNTNAILGDVVAGDLIMVGPDMKLEFKLPQFDTITESDVLALSGKTLYFTDTIMKPSFEYKETSTSDSWYSRASVDSSFNVKVTNVTFLDTATYQGYPYYKYHVRTYVITGSCRAQMEQNPSYSVMTGSFKMVMSRVVY